MKYEDLTPAEKDWLCNGCGPKLGIMPDLVPDFVFHEACQIHDYAYWYGKSAKDRKAADELFLQNMLSAARQESSWLKRRWYAFLAWRYYAGVRSFGSRAFSFREQYATKEDLVREMQEDGK